MDLSKLKYQHIQPLDGITATSRMAQQLAQRQRLLDQVLWPQRLHEQLMGPTTRMVQQMYRDMERRQQMLCNLGQLSTMEQPEYRPLPPLQPPPPRRTEVHFNITYNSPDEDAEE